MKHLLIFLSLCLLAVPTFAQEIIPTPDPNRYTGLTELVNVRGFSQIGFPNAPVSAVIYGAFDTPATAAFFDEGYRVLVDRARAGEVLITYVPMAGYGDVPAGRAAARGVICAGEQHKFFPYHDEIMSLQLEHGAEAYTGTRLIDAANRVSVDRASWDACMSSERPDELLVESDAVIAFLRNFTAPPFVTLNDVPILLDPASVAASINYEAQEMQATFDAMLNENAPTSIPTFDPNATLDPESTEPVLLELDPLLNQQVPPPYEIDLPEGWVYGYDVLVLRDIDAIRNMPIAVYTGDITGGTGVIVLLWGFPNILPSEGFIPETVTPNLFTDGLRLLPLAIVEPTCNVGTDLRRDYSIGGLAATGTQFAAVDCPDGLPDTRGWFAGLQHFNVNFMFYVFADPIDAIDTGEAELQAILDSITFVLPEVTPEATAEATASP